MINYIKNLWAGLNPDIKRHLVTGFQAFLTALVVLIGSDLKTIIADPTQIAAVFSWSAISGGVFIALKLGWESYFGYVPTTGSAFQK